jgi:hypothetical protein
LSTRALYYGTRGTFWCCTQGPATELNPEGWSWLRGREDPQGTVIVRIFQLDCPSIGFKCQHAEDRQNHLNLKGLLEMFNELTHTEFEMVLQQRCSIVYEYTMLHLTRSEDKLIALSGIAQMIQRNIGCHYYAGLWRECLPYSLLW